MKVGYRDFRIGIRAMDNQQGPGGESWSPWASQTLKTPAVWSNFVSCLAQNDPDGIQIGFQVAANSALLTHDIRLGIGLRDNPESQLRPPSVTPWLSDVLKSIPRPPAQLPTQWVGFSPPAADMDGYDPDGVCVGIQGNAAVKIPGFVTFHPAVRILDAAGPGQPLNDASPWEHAIGPDGGMVWSKIAFDSDRYDFDRVEIALAVNVYQPTNPWPGYQPGHPLWPGNPW